MSKSKSKQPARPKRFSHQVDKLPDLPGGSYTPGIRDAEISDQFGAAVAMWPHLEDDMISIFRDLVSPHPNNPARQIFRSLPSNALRIKVMRNMLQRHPTNIDKDAFYDEIISEFEALNNRRNGYVHGLWRTETQTNSVFLMESTPDESSYALPRRIEAAEITDFITRMGKLAHRIKMRVYERRMRRRALNEIPPQPDRETPK